jgi:hypothetical protein
MRSACVCLAVVWFVYHFVCARASSGDRESTMGGIGSICGGISVSEFVYRQTFATPNASVCTELKEKKSNLNAKPCEYLKLL